MMPLVAASGRLATMLTEAAATRPWKMALMLSGAVLAQVFNMLGATTGNIVTFVIISLVGNTLNLALNLLGCYVHDMRLQFLEFFGRFYKDGGKAFRPLCMQSNYVEIVKEEHE